MYSISYSAVFLRHVNIAVHLTLGKPPRNVLHPASNKLGLSRLRLEQCRPEAFTISANDSSRRLILPSAKRKSLPVLLHHFSWPPENENTLENGAAFQVNLRVVGIRGLLCRSTHLLCRVPSKESVSWKRQLKSICLHRNRSNCYANA